ERLEGQYGCDRAVVYRRASPVQHDRADARGLLHAAPRPDRRPGAATSKLETIPALTIRMCVSCLSICGDYNGELAVSSAERLGRDVNCVSFRDPNAQIVPATRAK